MYRDPSLEVISRENKELRIENEILREKLWFQKIIRKIISKIVAVLWWISALFICAAPFPLVVYLIDTLEKTDRILEKTAYWKMECFERKDTSCAFCQDWVRRVEEGDTALENAREELSNIDRHQQNLTAEERLLLNNLAKDSKIFCSFR